MDINEAGRAVAAAVKHRRARLADSGLADRHTRTLIFLLDRTLVSWGGNTVTVSLAAANPAVTRAQTRAAENVLTAALDVVPGTVRQTRHLVYTLTV